MENPPVDVALQLRRIGPWRLVCASYRGMQHIDDGSPRQDAFALDASGAALIVAVADGLGSANLSHIGADLACKDGVRLLSRAPPRSDQDILEIFKQIQRNLFETAKRLQSPPNELATTLQLLHIDQTGSCYARLGDGGCVMVGSEQMRALGGPDSSAVGVSNLSDPKALGRLQLDFHPADEVIGFLVFSDGMEPLFLDRSKQQAHEGNVRSMVEAAQERDPGQIIKKLNLWVASDHQRDLKDDKTLIVGVLDRSAVAPRPARRTPLVRLPEREPDEPAEFFHDRQKMPAGNSPSNDFNLAVAVERALVGCGAIASILVLLLILIRAITGCFWFDSRCPPAPPEKIKEQAAAQSPTAEQKPPEQPRSPADPGTRPPVPSPRP
jgi:hypothetical protein